PRRDFDARLDRRPQLARQLGERPEALWKERLETLTQAACEDRRITATADGDHDRRAIDDRRHDEARQLAIVDDVHRNVTALGLTRDPGIDRMLVGCRDRQAHAVEMFGTKLGRDVRDFARCCSLREAGDKLGCNDPDLRGGSQQQIDLAFGDSTAADDEHRLVRETQKNGEVVHGACGALQSGRCGSCRTARLDLERNHAPTRLQTALARIRVFPPPPAGARIRTRLDRTRARYAADARVTAIVQGVVRQVASVDVGPHVLVGPIEQRADFPQTVPLVPRHRLAKRALLRLFATHAGHPGAMAGDCALEWLDLADIAAAQALFDPEVETVDAVVTHVLFDQPGVRVEDLDASLITTLDTIEQRERFVVQPA